MPRGESQESRVDCPKYIYLELENLRIVFLSTNLANLQGKFLFHTISPPNDCNNNGLFLMIKYLNAKYSSSMFNKSLMSISASSFPLRKNCSY